MFVSLYYFEYHLDLCSSHTKNAQIVCLSRLQLVFVFSISFWFFFFKYKKWPTFYLC